MESKDYTERALFDEKGLSKYKFECKVKVFETFENGFSGISPSKSTTIFSREDSFFQHRNMANNNIIKLFKGRRFKIIIQLDD